MNASITGPHHWALEAFFTLEMTLHPRKGTFWSLNGNAGLEYHGDTQTECRPGLKQHQDWRPSNVADLLKHCWSKITQLSFWYALHEPNGFFTRLAA